MTDTIKGWLDANLDPTLTPWLLGGIALAAGVAMFLVARYLIARALTYVAGRTENKYDDIVVANLRPYRFAWIAPLLVIYAFADLANDFIILAPEPATGAATPDAAHYIRQGVLFLILWLVVLTFSALLNAVNAIYEASDLYRGMSIQGYLDLGKVLLGLVALMLTISLLTGESLVVLLSGLGAATAILLLIFRDTLLSFVASIQIGVNDLVKEGDWIEVPSYGADGDVLNIALYTVKIQNWDKSITVIPTYKLLDTPFKNWRGMEETGGRRIKRAVYIDLNSIRFCDREMIERFKTIDLVQDYIETSLADDVPGELTNMGIFRAYVSGYLKSRPDLHQEKLTLLVRQLAPGPSGMPLEIYAFTRTTAWAEYENIQGEIFNHLVAALPRFDLRVFQQPTGVDFRALGDPVDVCA